MAEKTTKKAPVKKAEKSLQDQLKDARNDLLEARNHIVQAS
jgi:hypothetical protein